MASLTTLARPYAKAAFELAQAEQALAAWDGMLALAGEIVIEESMAAVLENPEVVRAKVLEIIIDAAGDAFSERFRGFLSVLSSNGRLTLLPQVSDLFRELREKAENRLRVKVVSAVALDEDQAGRMREALARRFDREIELDNEVDAGIIGGAVVYAGDQVIDGSLKGRLGKLANSLAG